MKDADDDGYARPVGPLLYFRGVAEGRVSLTAIAIRPAGAPAPVIETDGQRVAGRLILSCAGVDVHRFVLDLPATSDAGYACDGEEVPVDCGYADDLRIAFVSCNGKEEGDFHRPAEDRNAMWRRLCDDHRERPFQLVLQGGDQIYADEVTAAHPLSADWPDDVPQRLDAAERAALQEALRAAFVQRYLATYSQAEYAWFAARVPTMAMWDDHDICDGWGSLPEDATRSDVGRTLFAVAREMFLVFQAGEAPDTLPAHMLDRTGTSLSWAVDLPGLRLVAPDLRSERTRTRIIGDAGWQALGTAFEAAPQRLILVSSVPALGPRLSVVERVMQRTPWFEKYEDDLRDQWQSRAHRDEWRRFLGALVGLQEGGTDVTAVSGEIHLATRGVMATARGEIHQLVASGISHPAPPRAYARALGTLARFGEAPLASHPIRLRALPGRSSIYVAQRNYLLLERQGGTWSAVWNLEDRGPTPPLPI